MKTAVITLSGHSVVNDARWFTGAIEEARSLIPKPPRMAPVLKPEVSRETWDNWIYLGQLPARYTKTTLSWATLSSSLFSSPLRSQLAKKEENPEFIKMKRYVAQVEASSSQRSKERAALREKYYDRIYDDITEAYIIIERLSKVISQLEVVSRTDELRVSLEAYSKNYDDVKRLEDISDKCNPR